MKNLLLTTVVLMTFGTSALASQVAYQEGADQMNKIIICQSLILHPDMDMQVTVSTGGIAGTTLVNVDRFFLGHTSSDSYLVKAMPRHPDQRDESVIYTGTDIRLAVSFTTLTPNDGHYGVLKIKENGSTLSEELSCELISQNPQLRYEF